MDMSLKVDLKSISCTREYVLRKPNQPMNALKREILKLFQVYLDAVMISFLFSKISLSLFNDKMGF